MNVESSERDLANCLLQAGRELQQEAAAAAEKEPTNGILVFLLALLIIGCVMAGVTILAIFIHFVSYASDHWCCCCPKFHMLSFSRSSNTDQGERTIAQRARLIGLTLEERHCIIEFLFRDKSYAMEGEEENGGDGDADGGGADENQEEEEEAPELSWAEFVALHAESSQRSVAKPKAEMNIASTEAQSNSQDETVQSECNPTEASADHDRKCCICLTDFKPGDRLLRGQEPSCGHQFHYHCGIHWMTSQDRCRVCRQELFTAVDFRHAALEIWGSVRVGVLGRPPRPPHSADEGSVDGTEDSISGTEQSELPSMEMIAPTRGRMERIDEEGEGEEPQE